MGSIIYKHEYPVSDSVRHVIDKALVQQHPPYRLALAMNEARIAHACTDISDGLQAACRNMLGETNLGIELDESKIPVHPKLRELAKKYELTPLHLSMAGGDWQFLYCIPKNQLHSLQLLEEKGNTALTVIGEVTNANGVWAKTLAGEQKNFAILSMTVLLIV